MTADLRDIGDLVERLARPARTATWEEDDRRIKAGQAAYAPKP